LDEPVTEQTVHALYELLKWGPTSANSTPARFVWVRSAEGKARLAALLC
jgi:3-hydroxypropanoate dehydrogenase